MKLTITELKSMIRKTIKEGMPVDENEFFKMKDRLEEDFARIYSLAQQLEDSIYDEEGVLDPSPLDLVEQIEQIKEIAGNHVR